MSEYLTGFTLLTFLLVYDYVITSLKMFFEGKPLWRHYPIADVTAIVHPDGTGFFLHSVMTAVDQSLTQYCMQCIDYSESRMTQ